MTKLEDSVPDNTVEAEIICGLVKRSRKAMEEFSNAGQEQVDTAVTALAWSIYKLERARELAELAVKDTGLGNVVSKIQKNQRKTFGALRDLKRVKSVGIIDNDTKKGIIKYAKPVGVVAAVCPSTNPAATPVNKAMFAVKGKNGVIIAPSPSGLSTTTKTVDYMRMELDRIGVSPDLVQVLPAPVNKILTQELMEQSDLVVVTGSQNNVRRAYSSGTPAIGVGAGNVTVIIDDSADLKDAAMKICQSKTFDNSTSCSAESQLIIMDSVYEAAIAALKKVGGYLCNNEEKEQLRDNLWVNGKLNRHIIAKDSKILAEICNFSEKAITSKFFMVEDKTPGPGNLFSDEKLSLALTIYKAQNLTDAIDQANQIMNVCGHGHSIGIHTQSAEHAELLAERMEVVRVLVNQAHTYGNGGGFNNGLNFTLSMGCGTWGGNSISENLNYQHFINITHLVNTIPEDKPSESELFGDYWEIYGKE